MKRFLIILVMMMSLQNFAQTTVWDGVTWSNGLPNSTLDVVIASDYNVGVNPPTTNLNCKTITINSGVIFTVNTGFYMDIWNGNFTNNGMVIFNSNTDIVIRNGIIVNNSGASNFIFEDGSALIQLTNTLITTPITFKRNTKPVKLNDYTYWSSPIQVQSYMQLPPFGNIRVFSYNQTGWVREWGGNMTIGKGYIVHRPIVNDPNPQQVYTMNFVGIPNNGNISITSTSDNNGRHLLGNPYPSVLDAVTFMLDNSGSGNRVNALYFWTHNTVISSAIPGNWMYNYTQDDYAVINRSGGTFLASPAPSPIVDSTPNNTAVPNGNIASGQGFFVRMRDNGVRTFQFNNLQKGYLPVGVNNQFYRQPNIKKESRLWLYLSDNEYLHRNMLISYLDDATNNYDEGFDEEIPQTTQAALYSIVDNKKLLIQGRENNISDERIPIGFKTFKSGTYRVGVVKSEGNIKDYGILLYDKYIKKIYNIQKYPYIFNTDAGEFNDRFELVFINGDVNFNEIITYISDESLIILNIYNEDIKEVRVYNVLGELIGFKKNLGKHFQIELPLNPSKGVYLIMIKTNKGLVLNKKIIK